MLVREAAKSIGCNVSHVRRLIRTGKLQATKVKGPIPYYVIDYKEVRKYKARPQKGGWPRGVSRS
jgi:excisionase family DNA binding protein